MNKFFRKPVGVKPRFTPSTANSNVFRGLKQTPDQLPDQLPKNLIDETISSIQAIMDMLSFKIQLEFNIQILSVKHIELYIKICLQTIMFGILGLSDYEKENCRMLLNMARVPESLKILEKMGLLGKLSPGHEKTVNEFYEMLKTPCDKKRSGAKFNSKTGGAKCTEDCSSNNECNEDDCNICDNNKCVKRDDDDDDSSDDNSGKVVLQGIFQQQQSLNNNNNALQRMPLQDHHAAMFGQLVSLVGNEQRTRDNDKTNLVTIINGITAGISNTIEGLEETLKAHKTRIQQHLEKRRKEMEEQVDTIMLKQQKQLQTEKNIELGIGITGAVFSGSICFTFISMAEQIILMLVTGGKSFVFWCLFNFLFIGGTFLNTCGSYFRLPTITFAAPVVGDCLSNGPFGNIWAEDKIVNNNEWHKWTQKGFFYGVTTGMSKACPASYETCTNIAGSTVREISCMAVDPVNFGAHGVRLTAIVVVAGVVLGGLVTHIVTRMALGSNRLPPKNIGEMTIFAIPVVGPLTLSFKPSKERELLERAIQEQQIKIGRVLVNKQDYFARHQKEYMNSPEYIALKDEETRLMDTIKEHQAQLLKVTSKASDNILELIDKSSQVGTNMLSLLAETSVTLAETSVTLAIGSCVAASNLPLILDDPTYVSAGVLSARTGMWNRAGGRSDALRMLLQPSALTEVSLDTKKKEKKPKNGASSSSGGKKSKRKSIKNKRKSIKNKRIN